MTIRKLGILALAGMLLIAAVVAAARPEALPEQASANATEKALAPRPAPAEPATDEAAADDAEAEDAAPPRPARELPPRAAARAGEAAPAGASDAPERGRGLATALQHVPAHVQAHLQSLVDAFASGLRGLGEAIVKPSRPAGQASG